uniref:C-type lectin domain-containing protein n=2 Tax=Pyrodinium bahamense TaxID=73915 RepID=A0A7R9ZVV6_9DINO|mmetsp:Transcript_12068/g.33095  ORF Transcript_12068/g.33095 Transcript_12068/m.33095 type:complete len:302 (+) Transcript_12068:60-965(+)
MPLLFFAVLLALAVAEEEAGCTITAAVCKNFPELQRKQFRDTIGEEHLNAGSNEAACLKRAEDFHHWCGNSDSAGAQVAATYNPAKWTQVHHPGACEAGWSQWDAFCYKHYWEKRNWFEAEKLCRDRGSHLASIHSRAENRFIYTLTNGLSAWIGYSDLDQDTHYKWSDSTQDDFSNFAKNCTGREHEPDCKPEERQQQWYDWEGGDAGTFVCKRNALLPVALLRNVTAGQLIEKPWSALLPALASGGLLEANVSTPASWPAAPELKVGDGLAPVAPAAAAAEASPKAAAPKFALPKASLL